MPEDQKTNINNLIIVWQGQSWSIIAPDGRVLQRYMNKRDAFYFAKNNTNYISTTHPSDDYLDEDFEEFEMYLYEKPKRHYSNHLGIEDRNLSYSGSANPPESSCFEILFVPIAWSIIILPVPLIIALWLATTFFGFDLGFFKSLAWIIPLLQNNLTPILLIVLTIFIPLGLARLHSIRGVWLGQLLHEPLTLLFGLGGILGVLLGLILVYVSFFVPSLDTWRVIINTGLWALLNYFSFRISDSFRAK